MLITITEARKIMGEKNHNYSDKQINTILDDLYALSNLIIDLYVEDKRKGGK